MKSNKSKILKARVTEEDYLTISEAVKASGLSESEFLRRAAKNTKVLVNNAANQKMIAHICQIQTMLNQARLRTDTPIIDEIQGEVSALCQYLS